MTILGTSRWAARKILPPCSRFSEIGKFKPAIDRVYPLSDAVVAAQRMASSRQFGKIVLRLDGYTFPFFRHAVAAAPSGGGPS